MNTKLNPRTPASSKISVSLGGSKTEAVVMNNVIIPIRLIEEATPWLPFLLQFQKIIKDRVLVTSVKHSFSGGIRAGTSHPNGWAIDITFPDRIKPNENPHLENDIYLMTHLAAKLTGPVILAFESDHVHVELSDIMAGVFRYPTSRPGFYVNDKIPSPRLVKDEQLWKVTPTSITLLKDQSLILRQRSKTDSILTPVAISAMVSRITL